jgi:zinc protease
MRRTLILSWLFAVFFIVHPLFSQEQSFDLDTKIPFDKKVIKGKLDNGITYYIRHNEKPKDKVELRLIVNAGSILEDDDQQGLAHFLEHMCFNGTEHFEKNELVSFLQTLGIEFGGDLNAYTSFDETVYMIPAPSEDLDTGLLVLSDWASKVTLSGEEIDKERGVILEELRLGRGAQQRMRDKYFPTLFKDSRYAERLPIGKKEIIENFKYETLRRFYKEWYRPDLLAVVAVGDVDPAVVEKKIREKFGSIRMPEQYRERKYYPVPDHQETYVKVVSDKEAPYTMIQIIYKDDVDTVKTWGDYKDDVAGQLFNGMMNQRLSELTQKPDPPFMYGYSGYGGLVRTKNSYMSIAVAGPEGIGKALNALLDENRRVKEYGFTQSELDRYKTDYLKRMEKMYNEREKTESARYVGEYLGNYLQDEPSPGIEAEYAFVKQVLPEITLEEVNKLADRWIKDYNRVVIVAATEKEGLTLPPDEEVLQWVLEADNKNVEAYVDNVSDRPLMADIPALAAIVATKNFEKAGITEYTLANGVKVVVKPTNFKDDEVLFSGYSFGGTSVFSDEEFRSAEYAADLVTESGVNGFSKIELQKLLAGKNVSVSPYVYTTRQGFNGSSTPADLETALQLVNLYFTKPNFDQEAFQSLITKEKMIMANLMKDPKYYFNDQVQRILANNHPRGNYMITPEELGQLSFDVAEKAYKKLFGDASGFTFFFTGNIDPEKDLPLLQKYLGALPAAGQKPMYVDLGIRPPKGPLKKVVYKGQDEKSIVKIYFKGETKFSPKEGYLLGSLGEVLTIKLIENLREEKSGVYGVGAGGYVSAIPYENYTFSIGFPCGPDNVDNLVNAALAEVDKLKTNGPEEKDVEKVQATQLVNYKEDLENNGYWLNAMSYYWLNKLNPENIVEKKKEIESLDPKKLKKVAKKYLKDDVKIEIVLMPEKYRKN